MLGRATLIARGSGSSSGRHESARLDVALHACHADASDRAHGMSADVRGGSRPRCGHVTPPKHVRARVDEVPLDPLEGYTVGITADRRAGEQAELLRRRGARVVDGPTIATAYLGSDERLRLATEQLIAFEGPSSALSAYSQSHEPVTHATDRRRVSRNQLRVSIPQACSRVSRFCDAPAKVINRSSSIGIGVHGDDGNLSANHNAARDH